MMPIINHTPHTKKQTIELVIASHATSIVLGVNCRFVGPQNGPTFHEHAVQSPYVAMGVVLHVLAHLSKHVIRNYLPIKIVLPCGQPNPAPWVLIPLELHLPIDMPYR
jgi:hypothetical protein